MPLSPDVMAFLRRGSDPRIAQMADSYDLNAEIEDNATSGRRPDLLQQMQAKLALEGLRNARAGEAQSLQRGGIEIEQMDPEFQRENRRADTLSAADTFMNPRMATMRGAQTSDAAARRRALAVADSEAFMSPAASMARGMCTTEDMGRRKAIEEMGLMFATDPRRQQLAAQEHQRKLDVTRAGSRFGSFLQPGGASAAAPPGMASRGGPASAPIPTEQYTEQDIREFVASQGGTEQDVMRIIAEASAEGTLIQR